MTKNKQIYVSYAWKVEDQNKIVDKLEQACKQRGLILLRDKNELNYKGSIRQYMDKLAAGDAIILVLSKAYFESAYCMYEICQAHSRTDFLTRIFPIVVRDTPLHDAEDRIDYLAYWEDKCNTLETKLSSVSRKHSKNLNETLDEYSDYRRLLDELLAVLADMNTLTEDVHVDSDFEKLLDQIQPVQQDNDSNKPKRHRQSDVQFRQKIAENIQYILEQQTNLCHALKTTVNEDNIELKGLVDLLCNQAFEFAIDDPLYPATKQCLSELDFNSSSYSETWEAAKAILGWLSLLVVRNEWVEDQEQRIDLDDLSFTVQVSTATGVEVASARFRQFQPKLKAMTDNAEVRGQGGILPPQLNLGWGVDMPLQSILIEIWNKVFPANSRQLSSNKLSDIELKTLNSTLKIREKRKTHHYYISFPEDHPIAGQVLKQLPSITIIFLASSKTKPTLKEEDEGQFISVIREFLLMNETQGN